MIEKKVTIIHEEGLHARPATMFVKLATTYESKISVTKDERQVNGKSLLSILSLGAAKGTDVLIQADGADEVEALNDLVNLLSNELGE